MTIKTIMRYNYKITYTKPHQEPSKILFQHSKSQYMGLMTVETNLF